MTANNSAPTTHSAVAEKLHSYIASDLLGFIF